MEQDVLASIEVICERLTERRVSLFLGAGINYGVVNPEGIQCPLGQALSDMLARDLLNMQIQGRPLDSVAEMARYRVGSLELNRYLHDLFKSFTPMTQHLTLIQLPWNVIYTTNYDTLVEDAAHAPSVVPAGNIRRVVSVADTTGEFGEEDILYFKLHGCIEVANTEHGRLILTKDDYRFYELQRRPLFNRLREDLLRQTLLFIGYGLEDDNFRAILEDCRKELKTTTFPSSFAVRPGATQEEKDFWKEKFNITTLDADGQQFLTMLRGTWNAQKCSVIPFALHHTNEYAKFDNNTSFQKVGESFYRVKSEDCESPSDSTAFFKGREVSWGNIRERVPIERDAYDLLLDAMLDELVDPRIKGNLYLVTGAAGTGKTTLVRMIAYELANTSSVDVVVHIPGTPLDERVLGQLIDPANPKRIVVIVEHAAERIAELERFVADVNRKKLPVTLIVSERKNLWEFATARRRSISGFAEFELERLSSDEIDRLLGALEKHDALGKLSGMSRQYQLEHFERVSEKELLVALRELTETASFDEIIRDEYSQIPSPVAKDAYRFVAALGQIDEPIRLEVLARLLEIGVEQIGNVVMAATDGILLSGEDFGYSRHNAGFRVRARHPVIASIVFDFSAEDDTSRYDVINAIIAHLNPAFPEDLRVLKAIVRNKALVNTIGSDRLKRSIYDQLETVLPNEPYVLQHRSLLERDLGDADAAIQYARLALAKDSRNSMFKNTLGFAYEAKARNSDPLERDGLLRQAKKIFEDGIRTQRYDPYGYLGLHQVMKQRERNETDPNTKIKLNLDMLSLLEDAYEATDGSHLISSSLAAIRETLGDREEAINFLKREVERKPQDSRLRDLLVRMLCDGNMDADALRFAEDGTKHDSTAWRLQRHIARIQRKLGGSIDSIVGHYESAFRHNRSDPKLIAEFGAFLFMNARYSAAEVLFNHGRQLAAPDRRQIREFWKDETGKDRIFSGHIHSVTAAVGHVIAVPQNFTTIFWRTREPLNSLREGDKVTFTVGFCATGAVSASVRLSK